MENLIIKFEIMDVLSEIEKVKKDLPQFESNGIVKGLKSVPPFKGSGVIKLIVLGQDPTISKGKESVTCTLNLDKGGPLKTYIEGICNRLGITLDNVYATNLFKYFYTKCPSKTPEVLAAHLKPNLELLKRELAEYPDCPVITLGQPVLQLLTNRSCKVRTFWNYGACRCGYSKLSDSQSELDRVIYPFPHLNSVYRSRSNFYRKNLGGYVDFMKRDLQE